jgi:L-asparaginase
MDINRPIHIITTGGAIDQVYNSVNGQNIHIGVTMIPDMLDQAENMASVHITPLFAKDSLDMDDADRQKIADACKQADEEAIVVTHGTDRMVETARVIAALKIPKTIIMTGAMRPFSFGKSDAMANLGGSLIAAQLAPHGVFICMNGLLFSWDNAQKDYEHGWFTALDKPVLAKK